MSGKKYCIAYGCPNRNNVPNLKFFSLPSDVERRRTWLSLLDREDLLKKDFKQAVNFVCSNHFDDSSIILTKKLKPNSVPVKITSCSPVQSTSVENKSNVKLLSNEIIKEEYPEAQSSSTQFKEPLCFCKSTKLPSSTKKECVTTGTQTEEQTQTSKDEQTHTPKSLTEGTPRKRQIAEPLNMEEEAEKKRKKTSPKKLDNKKSVSETERAKAKSRKLKYLANLTEEQKALKREKDREYFRKRMEKAKRKSIEEMSDIERNKTRDMWRESSKKYRQNKKTLKKSKSATATNITEQNESQTSVTSANVKNVMVEINEEINSLLVERPMGGEKIRQEWLQVVDREDLIEKLESPKGRRNYRICERHFETNCIKFSKNKTVKYLTDNAYPTLNLPSGGASFSISQLDENISASTSSSHEETTAINNQTSENIPMVVDTRKNITILSDQTSCSVQADLPDFANKMDGYESRSSQTAFHLSADTPKKRKLSLELRTKKTVDLNSVTKEDFLKLCDKFLNKDLALLVKSQIDLNVGYSGNRNETQVRREEPTLPEVEKEFEVEIEVKKETTDDPLSFDNVQVKIEPVEGEDVEDREEESRQRFVEVPIKNEPDDSIQIEENDLTATIHFKQEM